MHIAAQLKADLIGRKSDGKNELTKFRDNLMSLSVGVDVIQIQQQGLVLVVLEIGGGLSFAFCCCVVDAYNILNQWK